MAGAMGPATAGAGDKTEDCQQQSGGEHCFYRLFEDGWIQGAGKSKSGDVSLHALCNKICSDAADGRFSTAGIVGGRYAKN